MSNARTWVEALKISPENLSQWSAEAPAGKPLLVWCLEQGHIEAEPYFDWAKEFYKLPVLDSAFFPRIDAGLVESAKMEGSWHPWRFPVDKWDDITIVACVEPLTDQDHPHVSFVLADPRAMISAWGPNATHVNIPIPDANAAQPEGTSFSFSLPEASMPSIPAPIAAEENPPEENTPVEQVEKLEEPAGFTSVTKAFTLNLEGDLFGSHTQTPAHTTTTAQPIAEPPSPPPPAMEDDALLLTIPGFSTEEESEKTAIKSQPVPPAAPAAPAAKPTAKPVLKVVPKPADAESAPVAAKPGEENSVIEKAFGDILEKYNYCLLMKVTDHKAKLFKTDPNLKVLNAAHTVVDLSYPTFLRIVSKTSQPYHGYLVDSPAHRDFFGAFGINELPGCVTAVPVKKDNQVYGMLIGIGTSELLKADQLGLVSVAAARIAPTLISLWSKAS